MAMHDSSQPVAHEHHSRKPYYLVFTALMVGTALTVFAAFHDLSPWNMPIALAIAAIKAICVILIFMHVWDSPRLTKITVVAGIFWLLILFFLTMTDYLSRDFH